MSEKSILEKYNDKMNELKNEEKNTDNTTRDKIFQISIALTELTNWIQTKDVDVPVEVSYWKSMNNNVIKNEVEAIKSVIDPPASFTEFTTKREDIAKIHCQQKDGMPDLIMAPNGAQQYQFSEEGGLEFKTAVEKLEIEYKETLEEMQQREPLLIEFLEKDVPRPKYCKLNLNDVGKNISLDPWFDLFYNEGLLNDNELKGDIN